MSGGVPQAKKGVKKQRFSSVEHKVKIMFLTEHKLPILVKAWLGGAHLKRICS